MLRLCNCYLQVFKGEQLPTYKQELSFLYSARRLTFVLSLKKISFNGFHVKHRRDFLTELLTKFKREELKYYILMLCLCSAHRFMMLNTCMKFYEHILYGF